MSSQPLHALWEASASQPFESALTKDSQLPVGFFLLLAAFFLSSLFGLSTFNPVVLAIGSRADM